MKMNYRLNTKFIELPKFLSFGCRLKKIRKEKNLSQKDIARKLGKNSQTISNWERGQNTPTRSAIIKLANILKVEVTQLIPCLNLASSKDLFDLRIQNEVNCLDYFIDCANDKDILDILPPTESGDSYRSVARR